MGSSSCLTFRVSYSSRSPKARQPATESWSHPGKSGKHKTAHKIPKHRIRNQKEKVAFTVHAATHSSQRERLRATNPIPVTKRMPPTKMACQFWNPYSVTSMRRKRNPTSKRIPPMIASVIPLIMNTIRLVFLEESLLSMLIFNSQTIPDFRR